MSLKTYRELEAWQVAMQLVEEVYLATKEFPGDERFGLTSQLRRAAVSVPTNIAEGYGRTHRGDYLRFLSIARGSLCEIETLLTISVKIGACQRDSLVPIWETAQSTGRLLRALSNALKSESNPKPQTPDPH